MNTKTTLTLAFSLVLLVLLYVLVQSRPGAGDDLTVPTPAVATSATTHDLLEDKLGDITKVVCQRSRGEEWVFEKDAGPADAGQAVWRMTSPRKMKCIRWEVEKFGNQLGSLKYELSYKPGDAGAVTAAQAGLDPPQATVTLTDADGRTVTVEIGRPASDRETYVRLAGSDEILVGKSDLRRLVKDKALDYREKQLWDFKPENVTRVEIIDRSEPVKPVTYGFNRDGTRWMMSSPVTARATSKVDEMIRAMSRLRVMQWQDDRAERLAMYGLEPASVIVRATVEEQVPVEKDDAEAAAGDKTDEKAEEGVDEKEPETQTKITVYELHVSGQSPIGEDTKTYIRIGDGPAVATIMKSTTDKFKPVMSEWRDMRVTTVDTESATRIEMTTPEGSATLTRTAGEWSFEPDGGRAEASAVSDLVKAVGDLTAVAFIDEAPADAGELGLDPPRAEIRLTIPGVEGVERIAVGGYTDERVKRLVYVRRNELTSVAKVRTADAKKLMLGPRVYRDRAILDVPPSRFERITLSIENLFDGGRNDVTLERTGNAWKMIEPVSSEVRESRIDQLVEALGGLRAVEVVADEGEASAYGLHAPDVTVALTHKPPAEYRIEPAGGEAKQGDDGGSDADDKKGDKDEASSPVQIQPPSQTLELSVTRHDGKYYARRSDRGTIYEVTGDFYKKTVAEYRTDRVMDFDDAKVSRMSIRKGDETHVFLKRDGRWVYQAEPDLPLDSKKVDNLLLQIKDLRTDRYVRHVADDLSAYGLSSPRREVAVTLEDDSTVVLWVSDRTGNNGIDRGFYAAIEGRSGVFLLTEASVNRFDVSLGDLEANR